MKCITAALGLFTTVACLSAAAPTLGTPTASAPANGAVTLTAPVTTNGSTTNVFFRYGTATPLSDVSVTTLSDAAAAQIATASLTRLQGGQTYSFNVQATNADGTTRLDGSTFTIPPYAPGIDVPNAVPKPGGKATLSLLLNANGAATDVVFDYGLTSAYGSTRSVTAIPADAFKRRISVEIDGLIRGATYRWRATATSALGSTNTNTIVGGIPSDLSFTATPNRSPIARPDTVTLPGSEPLLITPLANDNDPEGDAITLLAIGRPRFGTAEIRGQQIHYTPIPGSRGPDTFTYTIRDNYTTTSSPSGAIATGTITVLMPTLASEGLHGVTLRDADGNIVGDIRVIGTGTGTLSGKVHLYNNTYRFHGILDAHGALSLTIPRDGHPDIPLRLTFEQEAATTLAAQLTFEGRDISGEALLSTLTSKRTGELAGRYTLQLPAPTGSDSTLPGGTGFARIDVREWGDVRIKGRLGDGSKFSASGVLSGADNAATTTFWITPDDARASLAIRFGPGGTPQITGTLRWYHPPDSGNTFFPQGFYTEIAPTGGRYQPPEKGERSLATENHTATLTLTNGNLPATITHQIEVNKRDKVYVRDPSGDGLTMQIDRKNGLFRGEFDHPFDGSRRKFQGALLQSQNTGRGVFLGADQTGTVAFTLGFTPTPPPVRPQPQQPTNPDPNGIPGIDLTR